MSQTSRTVLSPSIIAKEALRILENELVMANNVHREYKKEFNKVGSTVTIRKPNKFAVTESAVRSNSALAESSTSIAVDTQSHVSWVYRTSDMTTTLEDYSSRYIKPAMVALANSVDVKLCALYKEVSDEVGTPGTTPATFAALGDVAQRLDENAVPTDNRCLVMNPAANWAMADALKGSFDSTLAKDTVRKGYLGNIAGMKLMMDQNVQTHTCGARNTAYLVDVTTAIASGVEEVNVDTGTGAFAVGDVFTMAAGYAVNPVSGATYDYLKQFVCDTVHAGGTDATLEFQADHIYASGGAYNTVNALVLDDAAVTFRGTASTAYPINMGFHKNAFALVMLPMALPNGVAFKARESYNGISVRVVQSYDIANDEDIIRLDILYGEKAIYPELACRLIG